ncbi:hypothetical protein P59_213 [Bacillus phage P59]|nr:hypothetical protein P59_213 [Bacillus phage P59]
MELILFGFMAVLVFLCMSYIIIRLVVGVDSVNKYAVLQMLMLLGAVIFYFVQLGLEAAFA